MSTDGGIALGGMVCVEGSGGQCLAERLHGLKRLTVVNAAVEEGGDERG